MPIFYELNTSYALDQTAIDFYQKSRYIRLKQVFSKEILNYYSAFVDSLVNRLNMNSKPIAQRDT